MADNLIGGLLKEISRNKELLNAYDEIGNAGIFAATMIRARIEEAEKAMSSGDVVEMLKSYSLLKSNK